MMAVGDEVGAAYLEDRLLSSRHRGRRLRVCASVLRVAALRMKVAVEFRCPIDGADDLAQRDAAYPCPLTRSRSVTSASGSRESDRVMIIYTFRSCDLLHEHRRRQVCFPIREFPATRFGSGRRPSAAPSSGGSASRPPIGVSQMNETIATQAVYSAATC